METKTTIDLTLFDHFDAETSQTQLKLSASRFCICGKTDDLPGSVGVYINKKGNIVILKAERNGYPVSIVKGAKVLCGAAKALKTLEVRGAKLPQTADLEYSSELDAYVVHLELAEATPPCEKTLRVA